MHHPVVDRFDNIYTTAITNMDVHDIARSSCTFGLAQYYIVTPILAQRELANTMTSFWIEGGGLKRNKDRSRAMSLINVQETLENAIAHEQEICGQKPLIIATSAKLQKNSISYECGREIIKKSPSTIVIFGTGHGLAKSITEGADYVLEPVYGAHDYNHLSVRSAAAIILDRLAGR